jgi:phospholipid/cholesterol/gamma-HCH transport system substrate-binding protein
MPRTRSLAWSELKIGALTIFALVMATMLIFLLSGEGGFFWQRYAVKTVFPSAAGIKPGAPVRVAGVEVGSVTGVAFAGDRVEVVMELSRDMQFRVTSTSMASLGSVSLVGEPAIDITASSSGTPVPEWGYIPSGVAAGSLSEITASAGEGIDTLAALLQDLRSGRGTLGQLVTDESLYTQLTAVVGAAEQVVASVGEGEGTLGRLANDPAAAEALEASLQNLQAVTARIREGEGSLGKLLSDDTLAQNLSSTTTNLDAITGQISRGEGTAGKFINEPELYDRLNSMSERLDVVMTGLQDGQGTAGQLLHDQQLYENMNGAVAEVRRLVEDIRADPRRYLNIRVSLF